jgi:hypothetical protein
MGLRLGLGLGAGGGRSLLDSDALAYFNRAGVTSAAVTPTAYDNAASFNGTNQFLGVASNSSLQVNSQSFTFSAWVNPKVTGTLLIIGKFISGAYDYIFYLDSNNKVQFGVVGNNLTSTASVPLNQWTHVAYTYDFSTTTGRLYVNGAPSGSSATVPTSTATTGDFQIGARGGALLFSGAIGPCGFWKRVLSAGEITSLYNAGQGLTYSAVVSAGLTTNLISYWALNQSSVTADSAGTNTLTNNNSVTASVQGPIVTSTANSRVLLLDFIKGIKTLGLWNTFVCWPLRSGQNASTTLTAQSLGGLGTYNAALTNGGVSAWGLNGITASGAAGSYLYVPSYPVVTSPHSLFGVNTVSISGTAGGFANIIHTGGAQGTSSVGRLNLFGFTATTFLITGSSLRFLTGGNNQRTSADANRNLNTPYFRAASYNPDLTSISHIIDGTVISDGAPTGGTGNLPFTDSNTGLSLLSTQLNGVTNTSPFVGLCTGYLTSAQHNSIRALYKSTLGVGLGLA